MRRERERIEKEEEEEEDDGEECERSAMSARAPLRSSSAPPTRPLSAVPATTRFLSLTPFLFSFYFSVLISREFVL